MPAARLWLAGEPTEDGTLGSMSIPPTASPYGNAPDRPIEDEIRSYWDIDSLTYDNAAGHNPRSGGERAAWRAALARALPPAPARILDCGAGTGFLTLLAAELGHRVTALDLSSGMLDRLRARTEAAGFDVTVVQGSANEPPAGPFDAVMERHLLWTLPDPAGALTAWRAVAPLGRLVLVEGLWGPTDTAEVLRRRARDLLRKWRGQGSDHHGSYRDELSAQLPLRHGADPSKFVELVEEAGWRSPRLERLRDVEWAAVIGAPWPERLVGVHPRYLLVAQ